MLQMSDLRCGYVKREILINNQLLVFKMIFNLHLKNSWKITFWYGKMTYNPTSIHSILPPLLYGLIDHQLLNLTTILGATPFFQFHNPPISFSISTPISFVLSSSTTHSPTHTPIPSPASQFETHRGLEDTTCLLLLPPLMTSALSSNMPNTPIQGFPIPMSFTVSLIPLLSWLRSRHGGIADFIQCNCVRTCSSSLPRVLHWI